MIEPRCQEYAGIGACLSLFQVWIFALLHSRLDNCFLFRYLTEFTGQFWARFGRFWQHFALLDK
jgi:hypothetical protein